MIRHHLLTSKPFQALDDIERIKTRLMDPHPPCVLISSPSSMTLSLLSTMLERFVIETAISVEEAQTKIRDMPTRPVDFIIVDEQSETKVELLASFIKAQELPAVKDTKIIHMYTPTTDSFGRAMVSASDPIVIKLTKPPRMARLMHTLASLKNIPHEMRASGATDVSRAMDDLAAAQRTLFGNVLIAEGKP